MIDCFDARAVALQISNRPKYKLVEIMLNKAFNSLGSQDKKAIQSKESPRTLTIHADRYGYYCGGRRIETLEGKGIIRSMSRKGKSCDNAACEGFLGRMKSEMYYGRKWNYAKDLERAINEYIELYKNKRIKVSLNGMTIKEHREQLAKSYGK